MPLAISVLQFGELQVSCCSYCNSLKCYLQKLNLENNMHLFQVDVDVNKVLFSEKLGPNESTVFKHSASGKFRVRSRLATLTFYFQ